jgi:hypothetical protein
MKHLFFLLISISLFACTKFGRTHTAKGKVINPITGEGIPNTQMKILKHTLGLPGGLKSVKEATSDADGNYEISKSGLNSYSLRCELASDYYKIGWYDNGEKIATASSDLALKMGKTKNVDYYAVPYGELKISIHNVNCQGPDDSIYFERIYQTDLNSNIFQPFTFTGCYDNEGAFAKVPCGQYLIKWKVTKSGISANFTHLISVNENQQSYYNIDY